MSQVKVFVTDRLTDGLTDWQSDGRMSFNVPRFCERRGQKQLSLMLQINITEGTFYSRVDQDGKLVPFSNNFLFTVVLKEFEYCEKIVAAFQGMQVSVSPAKHSFAWLPRESVTTGQTDRQADRQTPDKRRTKWSLCAAIYRRRHNKVVHVVSSTVSQQGHTKRSVLQYLHIKQILPLLNGKKAGMQRRRNL